MRLVRMWSISYKAWSQMVDRKSKISFPMLGAIFIFHRLSLKKLWNYWWIWIPSSSNIACMIFKKSIFRMSMGRKISFIFRWKTMVIFTNWSLLSHKWRLSSLLFTCFEMVSSITWRPNSGPYGRRSKIFQWIRIAKNACILIQRTKQSFPIV